MKLEETIRFALLRQRVVLVHLLRGDFLVEVVEIMEPRRVVAETVQRDFAGARAERHDDAGETAGGISAKLSETLFRQTRIGLQQEMRSRCISEDLQ